MDRADGDARAKADRGRSAFADLGYSLLLRHEGDSVGGAAVRQRTNNIGGIRMWSGCPARMQSSTGVPTPVRTECAGHAAVQPETSLTVRPETSLTLSKRADLHVAGEGTRWASPSAYSGSATHSGSARRDRTYPEAASRARAADAGGFRCTAARSDQTRAAAAPCVSVVAAST